MTLPYLLPARLCRISKILGFLSLGVAVAFIVIAYNENLGSKFIDVNLQKISSETRDLIKDSQLKTLGIHTITIVSLTSNLFIFFAIANIFLIISRGQVFSLPAVKSIRMLGLIILIYAVMNIVSYPMMVGLWTCDNPAGYRLLSFDLNTYQSMMLLFGGLFLIVGHIYTQAVRMAEENRQYV